VTGNEKRPIIPKRIPACNEFPTNNPYRKPKKAKKK
jgi:hypothetical protein